MIWIWRDDARRSETRNETEMTGGMEIYRMGDVRSAEFEEKPGRTVLPAGLENR